MQTQSLDYLNARVIGLIIQLNELTGLPIKDDEFKRIQEKVITFGNLQKELRDYLQVLPIVDDFSKEEKIEILQFLGPLYAQLYILTEEIAEFTIEALRHINRYHREKNLNDGMYLKA